MPAELGSGLQRATFPLRRETEVPLSSSSCKDAAPIRLGAQPSDPAPPGSPPKAPSPSSATWRQGVGGVGGEGFDVTRGEEAPSGARRAPWAGRGRGYRGGQRRSLGEQ